jgi:two-component system chemotaxis response regulator CheB
MDQPLPWFIAVGASGAEGLEDIKQLLSALSGELPLVVLVVLHRAWNKPTRLREVLRHHCFLPVLIATDDERFRPGHVYIGKPEEHLTLAANSIGTLIDDPHALHRGRTADLLFRSVAAHAGSRMVGVVLAGALDDGSRGLAAIHAAGGYTMVVTPSGPPRGMPENAIKYDGPISYIGNAIEIGAAVCRLVRDKLETQMFPEARRFTA